MDTNEFPQEPNSWRLLWCVITSAEAFADQEVANFAYDIAQEQKRKDLVDEGVMPHPSGPLGTRQQAIDARKVIGQSLRHSLLKSMLALAFVLLFASYLGVVRPDMSWQFGKVLQFCGGGLAMWATLFVLGEPSRSFGGTSVGERVHRFIFSLMMSTGSGLALLGTLLP